jgi:cation diffusion facilitator CzcD-associated flavoprotein CzcO
MAGLATVAGNGSSSRARRRLVPPRIAIVGAGFGGIGLGIQLKRAGIHSFTILEKAGGVGGVWRDNTYPGLTCDVPSHLYSFSFAPKHDWSCRFPRQREILDYLESCARDNGLLEHMRFETEVGAADFDEESGSWRIRTSGGEEFEADVLVSATGQLSRPAYPDIPGLEGFEGKVFHSACWDHDFDLRGKRVAVVGTGASAIQFVPEIASAVEKLTLFQRTPPWLVRKPDRPYPEWERALYKRLPWLQSLSRARDYWYYESLILVLTRAKWLGKPFEMAFDRRLRRELPDPDLRDRLRPSYPIGCKRILLTNDWLETLARPNVEVVTEGIEEVGADMVVATGGAEHPVDAIILATGFKTTDFLSPMKITGLGGRDLNDAWRDGAEAHLGLTVSGFPNMFMIYGPNTNLGAGSLLHMLESQITYVVAAAGKLARSGARYMDVRPEVQDRFNSDLQRRLADTVWAAGCASWYVTESGKVTNNWPGFTFEYRRRTRRPDPAHFRFALAPQTGSAAG